MAVHEGVPVEENPHLSRLFGVDILGRLPRTGVERVRRTAVTLIGMLLKTLVTIVLTQPQANMHRGLPLNLRHHRTLLNLRC